MAESYPENLDPKKFPKVMAESLQEEAAGNLKVQQEIIRERNQISKELAELINVFNKVRAMKEDGEIPKSFLALADEGLREAQILMTKLYEDRKMRAKEIKELRQELDRLIEKYKIPLNPLLN